MMITELVDGEDFRQRLVSIGLVPPVDASPADLAEIAACVYKANGLAELPETVADLLRYKEVMLPEVLEAIEARTQDHERPAFPHHLQRLRQSAFDEFAQRFSQVTHNALSLPLPGACVTDFTRLSKKFQFSVATHNLMA
jgi:hypothetical protein